MDSLLHYFEVGFGPLVLVFTVSNLLAMGLQVNIGNVMVALRSTRFLVLTLVWGWIIGPVFAYLITRVIPLDEPYVVIILLTSLAPCAPFLQQVVGKAKGDLPFAGAFIPLVAVGTVVFMPLLAPLLIDGLTIDTWALAKPLLLTILIPLIIGALIRHSANTFSERIFPTVKKIAGLTTLLTIVFCFVIYGKGMLNTAGSFALLSMTVFMIGMGLITYGFGFGLKRAERSVMALGMGTRNIAAVLAGALAIPNADPRMVIMVIMWTLWSVVLAWGAAPILAKMGRDPG